MSRRSFWARTWAKLSKDALLRRGDRVLAAVSGGPDSVCLAHWLVERGRKRGFDVELVHVHHGLRGRAADSDEAFVRRLGRALGAPVHVRRVRAARLASKERRSLEDAARKARYQALVSIARAGGFEKVATAHQADDQAETVLLNLLRGASAKGLAGIPERRPLAPGIEVVRPLLALTRKDVEAYLRFFKLPSRRDATNRDVKHTRNWVRLRLLPLLEEKNPRIREHLAALAKELRSAKGR